ncbi:MAG: signal peptidase I [Acidimicrobiia bacterium]|nr:signal peptidase I [Acidimicrobiia bacterium]
MGELTNTPAVESGQVPAWPLRLSFVVSAFYLYTLAWLGAWVLFGALALGWDPILITSGSMEPHIRPGDMILVQQSAGEDLSPGSVVTFTLPGSDGELITHRVQAVDSRGRYLTKGDANPTGDSTPISPTDVFGVPRLLVSVIGLPILWLRTGELLMAGLWIGATAATATTLWPRSDRTLRVPASSVAVLLISTAVIGTAIPSNAALSSATTNSGDSFAASAWERFVSVVGGEVHSCGVNDEGKVWCWGRNDKGQLGDGTTDDRTVPVEVTGLSGAARMTAGSSHSCVVKDDATVWCWGLNDEGQLGDNTGTDQSSPVQTVGAGGSGFLTAVTDVAAGDTHTCAIKTDGTVWCWGRNDKGQLGDGTTTNRTTPAQVTGITTAVAVGAGLKHTCVATSTGTVHCWGLNDHSQLGDGTTTNRTTPTQATGITTATDISGGESHTCAVTGTGTVHCWGRNDKGQLGDGTTTNRTTPTQATGITTATDITTGAKHTCSTTSTATVYCWGLNDKGQLGDGTTTNRTTPTTVVDETGTGTLTGILLTGAGHNHTCAAHTTHTIYCWGLNNNGQLGNGTTNNTTTPTPAIGT